MLTKWPRNHEACQQTLRDGMASHGIEVTVGTAPPVVAGPYTEAPFVCPHGTAFWMEPTGEQITQWVKDGAP